MRTRWLLRLLALAFGPLGLMASPFQPVLINDADVAQFGGRFPLPRRHLASAILAAKHASAKAIVLKFFIDAPASNPEDDTRLAQAIKEPGPPVILQANLENADGPPPVLAPRFFRADLPRVNGAPSGNSGWIPLPAFAEGAAAIGFIDGLNPAPLIELHQNRPVPSLYLVALEQALGKARFTADAVTLGKTTLSLKNGQLALPFPTSDELKAISLTDLLGGKANQRIKGAIVIIGYDGAQMHTFPTPIGPIKAHRLFCYELELAYAAFAGAN